MRKIMVFTLMLALTVSSVSGVFAEEKTTSSAAETEMEIMLDNLESENEELTELSDELLKEESDPDVDYEINSEEVLKDELASLDASSKDYQENLQKVIENTNPETYANLAEEQADDVVSSLDNLDEMEPDETLKTVDNNGDTTTLETYKLDSGAEIVVGGIDESMDDDAYISDKMFAPCAITKATWVTNKNIWKEQGYRRYTAIYYLKVNSQVKGTITVTNHYTINKSSITMRSPAIWEYDCKTPFEVTVAKAAYKSSLKKLTKAGQEFYAGAHYYVSSMKKQATTVETSASADVGVALGLEASVNVGGAAGRTVEWQSCETKLHKIYAVVKLNKFTAKGAYLKQSGEVQFAK